MQLPVFSGIGVLVGSSSWEIAFMDPESISNSPNPLVSGEAAFFNTDRTSVILTF